MKNKLFKGNRRAVSPVIGTLLMVNIALAMGVVYFAWAQGSLTHSYSVMQMIYGRDIERSKEALVIEDARFLNSTYPGVVYELNITVRNIGPIDCRLTALYLNSTDVMADVDDVMVVINQPYPYVGPHHILVSDKVNSTRARVTFMFIYAPDIGGVPLEEGDTVNIIVTTERGTKANYIWEVSP